MTQEDKQLLLKDLSARWIYGTIISVTDGTIKYDAYIESVSYKNIQVSPVSDSNFTAYTFYKISEIKPYLRPLSSMTEEECMELSKIRPFDDDVEAWKYVKTPVPLKIANIKHFDFFHSHYLDWRGLIEKGLAIEAPEGMYNSKTE